MATEAQRAWLKRGREQAESTPTPTTTSSPSTSSGYRGPTAAQIKAGTLAVGTPSTAHRQSARTAALTQSGVRAGQTAAQAAAQATKAVYGTQSTQAKQAQTALINEQKIAASRRSVIKDLRAGVIGGVKVVQTPHVKTPVDPHIHIRAETLAGKKIADYPTVASQIASMQESQRRAYLQLTSDASKLQTAQSQLYLAEQRLNKYPVKDGKFVGTEAQYNQYLADHAKYVKKYNEVDGAIQKYNSDIGKAEIEGYKLEKLETKTRRAQYAGLIGVYEDVEAKIKESKYAPASEKQVRERIAEAEGLNPGTIGRIMDTFRSVRDQPDIHVAYPTSGTRMEPFTGLNGKVVRPPGYVVSAFGAKQAQAIEWMFMGGVQAAHEAPLKTAVSLGVGVLTPPAIKGIGAVGKAAGFGAKTAVVGKVGMAGIGALYAGSVAGRTVVDIPKTIAQKKYVPLALTPEQFYRAIGDIMATELIPLSVGGVIGAKAVRAAPHVKPTVKKAVTKVKELTIKEFNAQMRVIDIIRKIGMVESELVRIKPPKIKIKTPEQLKTIHQVEAEIISSKKRLKTLNRSLEREYDVVTKVKAKRESARILELENRKIKLYKETMKERVKPVEKVKVETKELNKLSLISVITIIKEFERVNEREKVKERERERERVKEREKLKIATRVKERQAIKVSEREKVKEREREKERVKERVKERERVKTRIKQKVKEPIKPVILVIPGLPKRKAKKKPIRKDRQIVTYTPYQLKNRVATIASLFG